jgi:glycosyltransferase involved in cell wall biosynthesis
MSPTRSPFRSPFISVILPLYNVAAWAAKAAASVASQPFAPGEAEVILIDDGSTDGSLARCQEGLGGREALVLRQANAGPGSARNAGLRAASGEYILFLDGDDFLLPGAWVNLQKALADRPDVLLGRYCRWRPGGLIRGGDYPFAPPGPGFTEYILGGLPEPAWNVWRYVCKRELIVRQGLFFPEGVLCEDVQWVLALLEAAGSVAFLPEPFYAYNDRRPNSIMNSHSLKRLLDLNAAMAQLLDQYGGRPGLCRVLARESFYYINEYIDCTKAERQAVYDCYQAMLPRLGRSPALAHRCASLCRAKPAFFLLAAALWAVKHGRRKVLAALRARSPKPAPAGLQEEVYP